MRGARLAALLLLAAPGLLGAGASPWLVVDAPREAVSTVHRQLLEVRGHGGARRGSGHDLVIVIDVSESTLEDSGIDLDGDGPRGRSDPQLLAWLASQGVAERLLDRLRGTQDFDDTVLAAELEAARALVERLDPVRFRVALVAFAEDARVLAPLGSPHTRLDAALRDLRENFYLELKGTNFAAGVKQAHEILRPEPNVIDDRLRSIVFLSDGAPTRPVLGDRAERYAVKAARAAALDGIRLFAFAIGPEAEAGLRVLERMAGWTSGRLETVSRPAAIVARLRRLDLVGIAEVAVVNETTGGEARAVRTFPDGTFDGFVELARGENRLRFAARGRDGSVHEVRRLVTYEPAAAPAPVGAAGPPADPTVEELRRRSAEIAAWAELERRRDRQRRELELRVENADPSPIRAPAP